MGVGVRTYVLGVRTGVCGPLRTPLPSDGTLIRDGVMDFRETVVLPLGL